MEGLDQEPRAVSRIGRAPLQQEGALLHPQRVEDPRLHVVLEGLFRGLGDQVAEPFPEEITLVPAELRQQALVEESDR